jgi:hypothetical protein
VLSFWFGRLTAFVSSTVRPFGKLRAGSELAEGKVNGLCLIEQYQDDSFSRDRSAVMNENPFRIFSSISKPPSYDYSGRIYVTLHQRGRDSPMAVGAILLQR